MFDPTPHLKTHPARRTWENLNPGKHAIHVITGIGRINFADLAKPRAAKPGSPAKFGCMILLPSLANNEAVQRAVTDVANKAFGPDWLAKNPELAESKRVRVPLKKQSELAAEYTGKGNLERAQYDAGGLYFRTASKFAPTVTNARNLPMAETDVANIKSGDWCTFDVAFYPYFPTPDAPNRGVSARLIGVQWIAPGLPFAEARKSNFGVIDIPAHSQTPTEAELFGAA